MRNRFVMALLILILVGTGCATTSSTSSIHRVGLLVEDTIDDQGWNSKGYQGLLQIQSSLNVDVQFKEEINSLSNAKIAVQEFAQNDVNLIFGHGRIFAEFFTELKDEYPHIHFVSFNGSVSGDNITSLHFESHSMGFFAGMVAAQMSETNHIGVIAAYAWQPEVAGFVEGVHYQDESIKVSVDYVEDWSNTEKALDIYEDMSSLGADVFYPAGDGFHVQLLEEIKKEGKFAIGFISDQSDLGGSTVLTSTVQHVDALYQLVADRYSKGELESGNLYYDFADGVISLGQFSSQVPDDVQANVNQAINEYVQTGKLPE